MFMLMPARVDEADEDDDELGTICSDCDEVDESMAEPFPFAPPPISELAARSTSGEASDGSPSMFDISRLYLYLYTFVCYTARTRTYSVWNATKIAVVVVVVV